METKFIRITQCRKNVTVPLNISTVYKLDFQLYLFHFRSHELNNTSSFT